jgi:hypothetical protein
LREFFQLLEHSTKGFEEKVRNFLRSTVQKVAHLTTALMKPSLQADYMP